MSSILFELSPPLKGSRSYIQGADIWQYSERAVQKIMPLAFIEQIIFKSFSKNAILVTEAERPDGIGSITVSCGSGTRVHLSLVDLGKAIDRRVEFDESLVWDYSTITDEIAELKGKLKLSFHESLISLIKQHCYHVSEPKEGAWIFVKAQMIGSPPERDAIEDLSVYLRQIIPGRFAKYEVRVNDDYLGDINFGVGSP